MLDDEECQAIEVLFKDFSKAFDWLQPSKLFKIIYGVRSNIWYAIHVAIYELHAEKTAVSG